jgi:cytoskeleton protein RodZ
LGWSPEQVAEQLKWAPRQVLALESDDYQALPGIATVRGFVRAYAKLLKLDPAPLLAQLEPGSVAEVLPVRRDLAAPFSEVRLPSMHRRGLSGAHWAIVGALALVLAVLLARQMGWLKPLPPDLLNRFAQSASVTASTTASAVTSATSSDTATGTSASASVANAASGEVHMQNGPDASLQVAPDSTASGAADAASADVAAQGAGPVASGSSLATPNPATIPPVPNKGVAANGMVGTNGANTPAQATTQVLPASPSAVQTNQAKATPAPAGTPAAGTPAAGTPAAGTPAAGTAVAGLPATRPGKPAVTGQPAPPAVGGNNVLVLKFRQDCWIEVKRVNGNVLLSRLLKAGETETVPMTDPVQLVVGNVAGVDAALRGAPLVLKNGPGNTARLIVK